MTSNSIKPCGTVLLSSPRLPSVAWREESLWKPSVWILQDPRCPLAPRHNRPFSARVAARSRSAPPFSRLDQVSPSISRDVAVFSTRIWEQMAKKRGKLATRLSPHSQACARPLHASHVIRSLRPYLPSWPYMVNLARHPGANTHVHTHAHMRTHTARVSPYCMYISPLGCLPPASQIAITLFPLTLNLPSPLDTVLVASLWCAYKHQRVSTACMPCGCGWNTSSNASQLLHVLKLRTREERQCHARDVVSGAWLPTHTPTSLA